MATSKNPKIQKLIEEVESLDASDENIEAKLQQIAEAVAAEQQKMRPIAVTIHGDALTDPADAFACDGCQ
ncbi:MAG TPA: hypothetical protein VLH86_00195 [Patescibacteria group bacterium]|nr:hypothetical protein [Patescibacteria group bacterium]